VAGFKSESAADFTSESVADLRRNQQPEQRAHPALAAMMRFNGHGRRADGQGGRHADSADPIRRPLLITG